MIQNLEEENHQLILDNENLKQGALESLNLMKNTESIEKEVENLTE